MTTGLRLDNQAVHGLGECPGCGSPIHVVGSSQEAIIRWACVACRTVGSAPLTEEDGPETTGGGAERLAA